MSGGMPQAFLLSSLLLSETLTALWSLKQPSCLESPTPGQAAGPFHTPPGVICKHFVQDFGANVLDRFCSSVSSRVRSVVLWLGIRATLAFSMSQSLFVFWKRLCTAAVTSPLNVL